MASESRTVSATFILAISIVGWAFLFWPLTVDDAYITFRFARHACMGYGLVWNIGEPPVEGMTSLLWTMILIPLAADKYQIYIWAKIVGLAALMGAGVIFMDSIRRLYGADALKYGVLLFACCPLFAFHALNGMETGLEFLLIAAMIGSAIRMLGAAEEAVGDFRRWTLLFGACWLMGGMTRPELVLYGALLCVWGILRLSPIRRWKGAGYLSLSFALPGCIYFLLRWHYFGLMLPLTFYAKRSDEWISSMGAGYVALSFLGLLGGVLLMALFGYWALFRSSAQRLHIGWLVGPALVLSLCYVAFRPVMGFVYRFTTPLLIPLMIAAVGAVSGVVNSGTRKQRIVIGLLTVAAIGQMMTSAVPAWHWAGVNSTANRGCLQSIGEWLLTLPERGTLVALSEVGAPSFFSEWRSFEGAGLVSPQVFEHGRAGGKRFAKAYKPDEQLVRLIRPDVMIVSYAAGKEPFADYRAIGYRLLKQVPWLVYRDDGPKYYQCVWAKNDYSCLDQLDRRLKSIEMPELEPAWYFKLYAQLKQVFGQ